MNDKLVDQTRRVVTKQENMEAEMEFAHEGTSVRERSTPAAAAQLTHAPRHSDAAQPPS